MNKKLNFKKKEQKTLLPILVLVFSIFMPGQVPAQARSVYIKQNISELFLPLSYLWYIVIEWYETSQVEMLSN